MAYISPLSLSLWERRPIRPRRGERERREPKNERNVNPKWKAGENTSRMLNNNGQLESVRGLSTALRPARDAVVWNLHPCAVVEGRGGGSGWTRPWRIFRIPCVCVCVCVCGTVGGVGYWINALHWGIDQHILKAFERVFDVHDIKPLTIASIS